MDMKIRYLISKKNERTDSIFTDRAQLKVVYILANTEPEQYYDILLHEI